MQLSSLPARPVSRPPLEPAPGVAMAYEPTPASGQPPVNPEEPTEPAPAVRTEPTPAGKALESAAVIATTTPTTPAGRELPPWVWAAILGVVCLLALLAGLFGR